MTPSTGQRGYRACLRCRNRKTKCDLDGVGQPKRPPCVSCYNSGSNCTFANSIRGGNVARHRKQKRHPTARRRGIENSISSPMGDQTDGPENLDSTGAMYHETHTELRNPADALRILAGSSKQENAALGPVALHNLDNMTSSEISTGDSLDGYELVKAGTLPLEAVFQLLESFCQNYHPFCPVVPSYMLGLSAARLIKKSDHFLLSVILTIASRDSPQHLGMHSHCWAHTRQLLLDVTLAVPWTQKSRVVEGLLLLSEWLPHSMLEQSTSEDLDHVFGEDRTAWSLIGLAVRYGYLMRIDTAAFRNVDQQEPREQQEYKRLIWTFIYIADRQISARLGQSFWSRGPSLSTRFTAKDFPTLTTLPGCNENYTSVLEATIELTQILHNAHAILYSSQERTRIMVRDGDYSRYLDDFQRAAQSWHTTWRDIQVSTKLKLPLFLLFEYVCLYVNAFSFQAILARRQAERRRSPNPRDRERCFTHPFEPGILRSPDGRYVFDAIDAATNIITLMNDADSQADLRYLPSRYYLYSVYASVFLYKASRAGAVRSKTQRREIVAFTDGLIASLDQTASSDSHIGRTYSNLLKRLDFKAMTGQSPPVASESDRELRNREGGTYQVAASATSSGHQNISSLAMPPGNDFEITLPLLSDYDIEEFNNFTLGNIWQF